jgi:hypothetical protein
MAEELIYRLNFEGADDATKNLAKLKKELADLTAQQKANKEALKQGTISQDEYYESQVKLEAETKSLKEATRQAETAYMANAKASAGAGMSIKQLSAELFKNKQAYQNLSKEERENAEIGGKLLKTIQEQDAEYKELQVSIGNTQVMVGSYSDAIQSSLPLMGGFGGQIQTIIGTLGQIRTALTGFSTAMKAQAVATNGSVNALKLFKIALISTGIGAIVVAIGSLIAAFASTQRGADAISRALAPVKEVFAVLVGFLQDKALAIFDRLKEAINNPKQAFEDLLNFIKQNVINRFNGIKMYFEGWSQTFVNVFKTLGLKLKRTLNDVPIIGAGLGKEALDKLDKDIKTAEKKVVDGAKKMANGALQAVSGIEDPLGKMANGFNKVGKAMDEANKRAQRMQDLVVAIRQSEITLNRDLERNRRKMEEQKLILENQLLPIEQRNKAGKEYMRLLDENIKRENGISKMKLEHARLSMEANDTDDEQKKAYYDMVAENERMLAEATGKRIEVQNKLNDFQKQAIAEAKKQEEERIKAQQEAEKEAQKTALENQKQALQERIALEEFEFKKKQILFGGTKQEEYEMEVAHQKTLLELKLEYAKLSGESEVEAKRETDLALLELEKKKIDEEKAQAKERQDYMLSLKAENAKKTQEQVDTAQKVGDEVFKAEVRRIEATQKREIDSLTLRRQAGEISQEEYEKKRLQIEKEAFKKKQNLDIKQVLINSAVAVSKIIGQTGVFSIPALVALAAQTAGQIATIKAQKFRFGGNVGGKLHSQGGTMIEAEKGEAVIMREAVNPITAPILSAINTAYGGNPIEAIGQKNAPMQMQPQRIEVVNVATETTNIANRVKNLQNARRI